MFLRLQNTKIHSFFPKLGSVTAAASSVFQFSFCIFRRGYGPQCHDHDPGLQGGERGGEARPDGIPPRRQEGKVLTSTFQRSSAFPTVFFSKMYTGMRLCNKFYVRVPSYLIDINEIGRLVCVGISLGVELYV